MAATAGSSRQRDALLLVAVILVHALLVVALVASFGDLVAKPFRAQDYTAHFYADVHIAQRLRGLGRWWGYDPFWMAGYPEGQVTLVDNKLYALFVSLAPRGFEALAFNVGVLLSIASVPPLLYAAARLCALERPAAVGAAVAGTVGTFSVPAAVVFWAGGGISFFVVSVLTVPVSVALASVVARGSPSSRAGVLSILSGVFTVFVHPLGAPMLAGGMLPAVIGRGRRPVWSRFRDFAWISLVLALPLLPFVEASLWLRGPTRPVDPAAHDIFRGGLNQLLVDWGLALVGSDGAFGAGGLLAIVILAALGRRTNGDRAAGHDIGRLGRHVVLTMAAGSALVTYALPELLERLRMLQPYRFVIPLCFFLCVPAGRGIARGVGLMTRGSALAWVTIALLTLPVAIAVRDLTPSLVLGHGFDPVETRLVEFVARATSAEDRILLESAVVSAPAAAGSARTILLHRFALMPLVVEREYLGYMGTAPFMAHRYASFSDGKLFGRPLERLDAEDVDELLRRYDVSWIVGCMPRTIGWLGALSSVLARDETLGECQAFRVRAPAHSRFLEGKGSTRAALDRIDVRDASGERLVLKYHWLPNLRTVPPLPIEEVRLPGAPVGFIGVRPGDVRSFTIELGGALDLAVSLASGKRP